MVSPSVVLIAIIGVIYFLPANSAPVEHEPINIIINENFKTQPSLTAPRWPYFVPGLAHHGANFYYNPHLHLSPSYIPYYTGGLMSTIHHNPMLNTYNTNSKVEDGEIKVSDTAKLLAHLLTEELSHLDKKASENEHFKKFLIVNNEESRPHIQEHEVTFLNKHENEFVNVPQTNQNKQPVHVKELVFAEMPETSEDEIEFNNMVDLSLNSESAIIDRKGLELNVPEIALISETLAMPEFLPEAKPIEKLEDTNPIIIVEDNKVQESVLTEVSDLSQSEPIVEDVLVLQPTITVEEESRPHVSEFVIIEAPEFPFHTSPVSIVEDPEIEETASKPTEAVLEENKELSTVSQATKLTKNEFTLHNSVIAAIPKAPVLPELSFDANPIAIIEDSKLKDLVEEIMKESPPSQLNIMVETESSDPISIVEDTKFEEAILPVEYKPTHSEVAVEEVDLSPTFTSPPIIEEKPRPLISHTFAIPEAPVLPKLSFDANPVVILEDSKIKDMVFSEVSNPSKFNSKVEEIQNASSPSEDNIIVEEESNPNVSEFAVIPEAPVLPELTIDTKPIAIVEDFKTKEDHSFTYSEGVVEKVMDPSPPFTSATIVEEEFVPYPSQTVVIPEAPVLPELSFNANPVVILEDSKIKDMVFSEVSNPSKFNSKVEDIQNASSPSEDNIIVEEESKPHVSEFAVLPEAPVLPELTIDTKPIAIVEDFKTKENHSFTYSEGVVEKVMDPSPPFTSATIIEEEFVPYLSQTVVIPEAPVLPELSFDANPVVILEDSKIKDMVFSEVSNPSKFNSKVEEIQNASSLSEDNIIVEEESKPHVSEFAVLPEAPVLPELTIDTKPIAIVEDFKTKENHSFTYSEGVVEKVMDPSPPFTSATIIEEEFVPYPSQTVVIPEAPVLPELSFDANPVVILEDSKIKDMVFSEVSNPSKFNSKVEEIQNASSLSEDNIIVEEESKPHVSEFAVLPEAPVLPELTIDTKPIAIVEDFKTKENHSFTYSEGVVEKVMDPSPPFTSATIIEEEFVPYPSQTVVIPEAPVLPELSFDANPVVILEDSKIKDMVFSEVSNPSKFNSKVEEIQNASSLSEDNIIVEEESKPHVSEFAVLPEAPVLPELTIDTKPIAIVEDFKTKENHSFTYSEGVVEKVMDPSPPFTSATIIEEEFVPYPSQTVVIPEAPVLPELSFDPNPVVILEEYKIKDVILQKKYKPIQPDTTFEDVIEISSPSYPNVIIEEKCEPHISELVAISEAPILPELSFDTNPIAILEDSKIKELESKPATTGIEGEAEPFVSNTVVIPEAPVLPELPFAADPVVILEDSKIEDLVISEVSKPTQFNVVFDEDILIDGSKTENLVLSELSEPAESETTIDESMDLSSLSQPTIVVKENFKIDIPEYAVTILEGSKMEDVLLKGSDSSQTDPLIENFLSPSQSKVATKEKFKSDVVEYAAIPEAPVLPELTFNADPVTILENYKIKELVLSKESKSTSSHEEVRAPSQPSVVIEEKFPHNSEFVIISEAPTLPEPSFDTNTDTFLDKSKIQDHVLSKQVFKPIQSDVGIKEDLVPLTEPAKIAEENFEYRVPEITVIPDAPILPEVTFDVNPVAILEKVEVRNPLQSEIEAIEKIDIVSPPQSTTVIEDKTRQHVTELRVIPKAPVLYPLSFDANPVAIMQNSETEKSISPILLKPTKSEVQKNFDEPPSLRSTLLEFPAFSPLAFEATHPITVEDSKLEDHITVEANEDVQQVPQATVTVTGEKLPHRPQTVLVPQASMLSPHKFYAIFNNPLFTGQSILKENNINLFPVTDQSHAAMLRPFIKLENSKDLGLSSNEKLFPLIVSKLKNTFGILNPIPILSQQHSFEPLLKKKFLISNEKLPDDFVKTFTY